jgi:hypothetical protein
MILGKLILVGKKKIFILPKKYNTIPLVFKKYIK